MKQQHFETQRADLWTRFETALDALDRREPDPTAELPRLYRQVCQDLALARDRFFTEELVLRLNRMALRGHEHLYGARSLPTDRVMEFVLTDFPRAVRHEARLVLALGALLFAGMGLTIAAVQIWPDLPRSFLSEAELSGFESMYADGIGRTPAEDLGMFGHYVRHNVSIDFNTFAGGVLFGVGSLLILALNAVGIGLMMGHIVACDLGDNLFPFVIGHSSFELTALVLAAVAGMRLGFALLAPDRFSRRGSLRRAAGRALPILYGACGMTIIAAVLEAFWSASAAEPPVKYAVGVTLWGFVVLYLGLAGRARAA